MNFGTKLRTILAIATALNTANVMSAFAEFDNPIISTIYKALSLIALIIVLSANTYYNNDYTNGGEIGTRVCRTVKADEADGDMTLHDEIEHLLGGDEDDD